MKLKTDIWKNPTETKETLLWMIQMNAWYWTVATIITLIINNNIPYYTFATITILITILTFASHNKHQKNTTTETTKK